MGIIRTTKGEAMNLNQEYFSWYNENPPEDVIYEYGVVLRRLKPVTSTVNLTWKSTKYLGSAVEELREEFPNWIIFIVKIDMVEP